ncbi:hypothetical protein AVEN_136867-1 [Araneus ventricosus]|uniref:Uncharacterized protein n=1 Tax=Araneus ventricosus TaxID=182803 RepID=A0A4Y2QV94_ARAVE|nr:hypothetical protein AVEN_136867-1 [Araneus ventricosus]
MNLSEAYNATAEVELSSGHLPSKFWLNTSTEPNVNKIYKPHWKKLQQEIVNKPTNNFNPHCTNDIEEEVKRFTIELQNAFKETGEWVEKKNEEYSEEIKRETHIRNKLKKIVQRSRDPRDKNFFKGHKVILENYTTKETRKNKRKSSKGLTPTMAQSGSTLKDILKHISKCHL